MAAALDMATELVAAAVYGEADNVAHILTQHPATLNAVAELPVMDKRGAKRRWNALQTASYYGKLEVVQVLVAMGADLDTSDPEGETALMLAVEEEHKAVVVLLLERGARMDLRTVHGFTVMINAAASNQAAMLQLLLLHGGRQHVNDTDGSGCSALWWAAKRNSTKTLKMLLVEGGADPFLPNHAGIMPLAAAVRPQRYDSRTQCYDQLKHIERALALFKARRVHEDGERRRQLPTAPLPRYYLRDGATAPLPQVTVVGMQGKAKRGGAAWEAQMERHETMQFVVGQLGDDLFRELLDGLRLLV